MTFITVEKGRTEGGQTGLVGYPTDDAIRGRIGRITDSQKKTLKFAEISALFEHLHKCGWTFVSILEDDFPAEALGKANKKQIYLFQRKP